MDKRKVIRKIKTARTIKYEMKCLECGKHRFLDTSAYENGRGLYCSNKCKNLARKNSTSWNKGLKGYNKDYPRSKEWGEKIGKAKTGMKYPPGTGKKIGDKLRGKKLSKKIKKKMSIAQRKRWGTTGRKTDKRNSTEYKKWHMAVFLRDNFTCQFCGGRDSNLEAHHIKSWAKYKKLRYIVNNGVTLCRECHKLAHKINDK